ncbi:hypothetical protein MOO46_05875 [Apilactobacillus apisilvae]|uniref:Uncharacterized protein n=1 Tax=Apilactobacillus apisilvae TaxID=2923364 RepID=A0ABY4PGN9_9LACO|nr:hypothetical protein [Apilactobacillus apisilvae]UQS84772.1 hypothetical protein MOO46_05875 [Apilactobacillus apisilvae]
MNNIIPDIAILESVTKIKINDLAEQVKAAYFYFNRKKNSLSIDESNDEYISFSFNDHNDFILNGSGGRPSDIEQFIGYLGNLGAKFDVFNILDDNDETKIISINFNVKRLPL